MTKRESDERARKVKRAIRLVWGSLDSHLEWCYSKPLTKKRLTALEKKLIKDNGSPLFHKKCVREYAKLIQILAGLY